MTRRKKTSSQECPKCLSHIKMKYDGDILTCPYCHHSELKITQLYRNGERCQIRGCDFTDVRFHHVDYKSNSGFYACKLHHAIQHVGGFYPPHMDRVMASELIELMVTRHESLVIIPWHGAKHDVDIILTVHAIPRKH
jgi:hypothetical protein